MPTTERERRNRAAIVGKLGELRERGAQPVGCIALLVKAISECDHATQRFVDEATLALMDAELDA